MTTKSDKNIDNNKNMTQNNECLNNTNTNNTKNNANSEIPLLETPKDEETREKTPINTNKPILKPEQTDKEINHGKMEEEEENNNEERDKNDKKESNNSNSENHLNLGKRKHKKHSTQIGETEWWIIKDPKAENPYYYNAEKQKTVWNLPIDFLQKYKEQIKDISMEYERSSEESDEDNDLNDENEEINTSKRLKTDSKEKDLLIIDEETPSKPEESQSVETANENADIQITERKSKKSSQIGDTEWWEIDDPKTSRIYYFNSEKNKTVWDLPEEIIPLYQEMKSQKRNERSSTASSTASNHIVGLSSALINLQNTTQKRNNTANNNHNSATNELLRQQQQQQQQNLLRQQQQQQQQQQFNGNNVSNSLETLKTNSNVSLSSNINHPGKPSQKTSKQFGTSEWWEISDPNCDRPYFYSTMTQRTQWEKPNLNIPQKTSKQIGDTDWWEIRDSHVVKPYYYDVKTQLTQWNHPFRQSKVQQPQQQQQRLLTQQQLTQQLRRQNAANLPQISNAGNDVFDVQNSFSNENRTAFDSRIPIASLKCEPFCEAKTRAHNLETRLNSVIKQKKLWQHKYGEAQDQMALIDKARETAIEADSVPGIETLTQKIPKDKNDLFKCVCEAIENVGRNTLMSAASTSDLRQTLFLKASNADRSTLEILFKFLYQPPSNMESCLSSNTNNHVHPTHAHSLLGEASNAFDYQRAFPCFICSKRFYKCNELEKHLKEHTRVRDSIQCLDCEACLSSELVLEVHKRQCLKGKRKMENNNSNSKGKSNSNKESGSECEDEEKNKNGLLDMKETVNEDKNENGGSEMVKEEMVGCREGENRANEVNG